MAERMALVDPRTANFYARRVVELAVTWAFRHDRGLTMPYESNVSALLHEPSFKRLAGDAVFLKAKEVVRLGNAAAHRQEAVSQRDSVAAVSALFEFTYWFARTYNRGAKPEPGLSFDPRSLPNPRAVAAAKARTSAEATAAAEQARAEAAESLARVQELEARLAEQDAAAEAERQRALADASTGAALRAEVERLSAELAAAKQAAAAQPDTHDYTEAQTRDWFIDLLLAEAGWDVDAPNLREVKVDGMPDGRAGFVDYVLWGDDGKPLGLIEAKRTRRDSRVGQEQASLYANRLEAQYGQRPVIFTSNGFEHWIWDDHDYPARRVAGFYTKGELELLVQRRTSRVPLTEVAINAAIADRPYQHRAIRKIAESFERDHERKALLVMATGSGKTRTVIALSDLLIRANRAKRILFLADRTALVNQAVNAFKAHLPDSSPVNLVTERHADGRVYASTYQTMMGLIEGSGAGPKRFGPGYFDLVVIDEAHRSVFKKYRAIFDHFDSLLVGLTATPREEIDRSTYALFDLEEGVPTDAYALDEAVHDGYLVPPTVVSVPTRFQREGIRYDQLSPEEQDQWEELDWDDEHGDPPDAVSAEAMNRWLFNADTVDKVIETLMTDGIKVAGGDRIGKTIIFAKNQEHAHFIAERFDVHYPDQKGTLARVITHKTEFAQSLIDKFSTPADPPHIAISVDMLDTGIDVPEVVNLVFFKAVRSKIKFWQMIGRGTRLCPDLFGPGMDKETFQIFDFCQNFEFFGQNPELTEATPAPSVRERRFLSRLDLLRSLRAQGAADPAHQELGTEVADLLWREVDGMTTVNFAVRPHRRTVERFGQRNEWITATIDDLDGARALAGLPSTKAPEDVDTEEAKRFDVLLLQLQLALLQADPSFLPLRKRVVEIASLIEEYPTIPAVKAQLGLIAEVQTDQWWEDVTLAQLEQVRRRLRTLVGFIEKRKRKVVYTDFADELGTPVEIPFGAFTPASDFERFRRKAGAFLRDHRGETAIKKIHQNWPITPADLAELQRILVDSGVGTAADVDRAAAEAGGFGLFVRSLVGLDRAAAKDAFASFVTGNTWSGAQIQFINLVIDALTQQGVVEPARFYESPFTDLSPQGPEALFAEADIARMVEILDQVRAGAATA